MTIDRTAGQTTPETAALRVATRALREHLDELPVDYNLNVPGDRFLTGLAFMFARQRYDCADSMIGAGFGGTVLGSWPGACLSTACAGFGSARTLSVAGRCSAIS